MCTLPEFLHGGREIEMSGTGRNTAPYNLAGYIDPVANSQGQDCGDWDTTGVLYSGMYGVVNTTLNIATKNSLSAFPFTYLWCCTD
jgi:hypothetical protein